MPQNRALLKCLMVFFSPLQLVQRIQMLLQLLFSLQVNHYLLSKRFVRH